MRILQHQKLRLGLSILLIGFYAFLLIWMGALMNENSSLWGQVILFTWVVGTPVLAYVLGIIWRYQISFSFDEAVDESEAKFEENIEATAKRKRANLDSVLRDLSDDDLVRLRERLQDGTVDDDVLYDNLVGDDGELLTQESYR